MALPTLVQRRTFPCSGNSAAQHPTTQIDCYIDPSGAGNAIGVDISADPSVTSFTITDDKGNSYTAGPSINSGQLSAKFIATNVAAGTRHIIVSWGTQTTVSTNASVKIFEWTNIATTVDGGSSTAHTASATPSAGSFTPSAANCLIWCTAWEVVTPAVTSIAPGTNFTLHDADVVDTTQRSMSESWQQGAAAAINASFTTTSSTYNVLAWALKTATQGTEPDAGIREAGQLGLNANSATNLPLSITVLFPNTGNGLILTSNTAPASTTAAKISTITDSTGATWTETLPGGQSDGQSVPSFEQIFYAKNVSASNSRTLTITFDGANAGTIDIQLIDCANADTATFYNSDVASTSGNIVTSAIKIPGVTLTPGTANALCICRTSCEIGAGCGVDGYQNLWDLATYPEGAGGFNPLNQDNCHAHTYNQDTHPIAYSFATTQMMNSVSSTGHWGAIAASFKAATPTAKTYSENASAATKTFDGVAGVDSYWPWICPQTINRLQLDEWGGGGCGSRRTSGTTGGGGGRGGDYSQRTSIVVIPGNCYVVRIGGGGTNATGTVFSGQSTKFVDDAGTNTEAASGVSVANNVATSSITSTGTTTGATTHGTTSSTNGTTSGGAGGSGSGGNSTAGSAGAVTTGGAAGTGTPAGAAGGAGGASGATNPGVAGTAPGGGGGGAFFKTSGTGAAGKGAPGRATFTGTATKGFPFPAQPQHAQTVLAM